MSAHSHSTTDHDQIRRWSEERGGRPVTVKGTGSEEDPGILRIDMPGYTPSGRFEEISWDEWFQKFDEKHLEFLYQDETGSGEKSNFYKLVSRETAGSKK
jgi:hypothetical protein